MIETTWVITSGYVDKSTLQEKSQSGWQFIITLPAKMIHPNAADTDKATLWTRYTQHEPLDKDDKSIADNTRWVRLRFHANAEDYRPVKFPPPGPYWCTGYDGDDEYSIVVAYFPIMDNDDELYDSIREFWPEAKEIEFQRVDDEIVFTSRFPKPNWWDGVEG